MKPEDIIPPQQEGASSNIFYSKEAAGPQEAQQLYRAARQRLLQVNSWSAITGTGTADFRLVNERGEEVQAEARPGLYFRIDIPGPGSVAGEGYDWVRIEAVEEENGAESEMITVTVRPAHPPHKEQRDVAHFFDAAATSSFSVRRQHQTVTASVMGRNEKPNTGTGNLVDKARNAVVAVSAMAGGARFQWKNLVHALIEGKA